VPVDENEVIHIASRDGASDRDGPDCEENISTGSWQVLPVLAVAETTQFRHGRETGESLPLLVRRCDDRVPVDRENLVKGLPDGGGDRRILEQSHAAVDLGNRHGRQDDRLAGERPQPLLDLPAALVVRPGHQLAQDIRVEQVRSHRVSPCPGHPAWPAATPRIAVHPGRY
jgi:hypothetical protein